MRVKFTRLAVYDTNGPGKGPVYEAGSVHDLRQDEAERWFRRGVAVEAPPEPDLVATVVEPEPEPETPPAETVLPDEPAPSARIVRQSRHGRA